VELIHRDGKKLLVA